MRRILGLSLLFLLLGSAAAQPTIQLILDASGSMFEPLDDGRYRITAAKDVLADLISALPADDALDVGLRVYGAQSDALADGACTDSELVVPMSGFDRQALLDAVRETQARGATPIAYSLERAAGDFQGVEGDKLVVLVTDGEESCMGDVRGLAQQLSGIEVDLRIIGFDLSERAAASFEGIGAFENARTAAELAQALGRAVEPAAQAQDETYPVTVHVTREGQPAEGAGVTLVSAVSDEEFPLALQEPGTLAASVPAGQYRAVLEDALTDEPQTVSNVNVVPESGNVYAFELAGAAEVDVTVSPADPMAGSRVTVAFAGAPEGQGWVTVVPPEAPDDVYRDWTYVSGASGTAAVGTPPEPGQLEARYLVELPEGGSRLVGRSERFSTVAAEVVLDAPAEAFGGSRIDVAWSGPDNENDYVTIVEEGAPQGTYDSWAYTASGTPLGLTVPVAPGAYEIRYVAGQGDAPTLASVPLTVRGAEYAVQAPERVPARSTFEVAWTGPDNSGDYITIVPVGAPDGAYDSYAYTREGNPVLLEAPAAPGRYEVRYTTEQNPSPTLASQPIEVMGVDYTINAPETIAAGSVFEVAWTGPDASGDYITIVPAGAQPGAYLDYAYTAEGSPATLTAPDEPGAYEVRYQSDGEPGVFASQPVTVE